MTLCSRCSEPIKPIVAFDVDGTLTWYHQQLYEMIVNYYGITSPREDQWDGHGNFEDWMGLTREAYRDAKLAFRQGGFKRWAPPQVGIELLYQRMETLRHEGKVEIWITTTRPWLRMDNVDPDTRYWLSMNFPCYDHLLYGDDKYTQLAKIVDPERVIAVVEDLPEKYLEAVDNFGIQAPLLIERPHNEWWRETGCEGVEVRSVPTLRAAALSLEERIERWHNQHGTKSSA